MHLPPPTHISSLARPCIEVMHNEMNPIVRQPGHLANLLYHFDAFRPDKLPMTERPVSIDASDPIGICAAMQQAEKGMFYVQYLEAKMILGEN